MAQLSGPAANPMLPPFPGGGAMRGADAFVDTLIRLGCEDAFNVIGLGMYPLGDAFHRRRGEIRYISHVNETNLALTAQGYARAKRRPACAVVYYSSGTSLAMIGLTVAWADRAPLVLVSTTNSRLTSGRDQYAGVPRAILEMGAQYTKWSYEVPTADRIPEALARAFAIAAQPPMGPVHLAIPSDLWGDVFAGPPPRADFERTQSYVRSVADAAGLAAAADLLANAERPVLLFGSEVGQYDDAIAEAVRLAEVLGAPVLIDDQPAYLAFPTSHANYIGKMRPNRALLAASDVVLSVGIEFTQIGIPGEPPPLPATANVIALSVDPALPVRQLWPDLALTGHPQPSLARLATLAGERISAARAQRNRAATAALRAARLQAAARVRATPWDGSSVLRSALIDVVHQRCGAEWIVVDALTSAVTHFDALYELDDPRAYHGLSGKGSAQGWGAPSAIGVQLGSPGKRVVCLLGDGNLMFTSSSLYLAGKMKLPMVFVLVNNGGWAHIRNALSGGGYDDDELRAMGWLFDVDYCALARSFGLTAARATTAAELASLLEGATASDEPWLIDTITEGDDPA
jgi:thiamine pyrophosphate-dependent acetolactate synthase large subunit-like protein